MAIIINCKPNRSEGIAPLAVLFDASETTSDFTDRPFHELHYEWDFGDDFGENWAFSGKPKNKDTGPIAGHLFTCPGNFTVTLTTKGRNSRGEIEMERTEISVRVENPERIFAESDTICFSTEGNFSGAPSGAIRKHTSDFKEVIAALDTGKRILLKRGERWKTKEQIKINKPGPGILGAFGNEDKLPIIENCSGNDLFRLSSRMPLLDNWIFQDLDLQIPEEKVADDAFSSENAMANITFYRIKVRGFKIGFSIPIQKIDYYQSRGEPVFLYKNIAIIQCEISEVKGGAGGYGIFVGGEQVLLMGNKVVNAEQGEHNLRGQFLFKSLINHNYLAIQAPGKHVIKLHSLSDAASIVSDKATEQVVIANNEIIGSNHDWVVGIAPQSARKNERLKTIIIEKNWFQLINPTPNRAHTHLIICAQEITIRNNLFNMQDGLANAIRIFKRGIEPKPDTIFIYNNTAVKGDSRKYLINITADTAVDRPTNIHYNNNLVFEGKLININESAHFDNEEYSQNPGFLAVDFNSKEDFRLLPPAEPIDAGALVPVFDDFADNNRQVPYDIGAYEVVPTSDINKKFFFQIIGLSDIDVRGALQLDASGFPEKTRIELSIYKKIVAQVIIEQIQEFRSTRRNNYYLVTPSSIGNMKNIDLKRRSRYTIGINIKIPTVPIGQTYKLSITQRVKTDAVKRKTNWEFKI